jgi:hypothetical protein
LGDGDARALRWYSENCSPFAKDFGLVPVMFASLGLEGEQRRMFLSKLDAVHAMAQRLATAEAEKERR